MSEVKRYRFKGAAGEYVYANDFDRVQAENQALQARLTVQDQQVDELSAALRPLLAHWDDLEPGESIYVDRARAALNPTAEAASHDE